MSFGCGTVPLPEKLVTLLCQACCLDDALVFPRGYLLAERKHVARDPIEILVPIDIRSRVPYNFTLNGASLASFGWLLLVGHTCPSRCDWSEEPVHSVRNGVWVVDDFLGFG
jgi:hypothetical protein